jgi:methylase of polypeptide subunit release factors
VATKIAEKAKIMERAAKINDENGNGTKIAMQMTELQKKTKNRIAKNHSNLVGFTSILKPFFSRLERLSRKHRKVVAQCYTRQEKLSRGFSRQENLNSPRRDTENLVATSLKRQEKLCPTSLLCFTR